MKVSEYIAQLQALQNAEGDVEVVAYGFNGGIVPVKAPETKYLRIMTKRESVQRVWGAYDGEAQKGEKVVQI
jgi:hypothetical protein